MCKGFHNLQKDEKMVDVTIAAGGKIFKAHKLVRRQNISGTFNVEMKLFRFAGTVCMQSIFPEDLSRASIHSSDSIYG